MADFLASPYRRMGMTDLTCYDLLRVTHDANDEEIRRAYRAEAKRHHPDTNPLDRDLAAARFRLIQESYDLLRDPVRRQAYDTELKTRQWWRACAYNDNLETELSDVITRVRTNLERLMRLMENERRVGLTTSTHQDNYHG